VNHHLTKETLNGTYQPMTWLINHGSYMIKLTYEHLNALNQQRPYRDDAEPPPPAVLFQVSRLGQRNAQVANAGVAGACWCIPHITFRWVKHHVENPQMNGQLHEYLWSMGY
jgi:hypothetical protein